MKTALLLINLGTPLTPNPSDVFPYLTEFLTDERVIEKPFWVRQLLVRCLIVPLRFLSSAKAYQKIWDEKEGSPLMIHSKNLQKGLQNELGEDFVVELAMRYQEPSISKALERLYKLPISKIIVFPLFPQYASATTGSIYQKVMEELLKWKIFPNLSFISSFYDKEPFIKAWARNARKKNIENYDYYVFSFHGLPESHITGHDRFQECLKDKSCCKRKKEEGCYKRQCIVTKTLLEAELQLPPEKCVLTFQSRLGKEPWLAPSTEETLKNLRKQGAKRVLVFCPSFVADCLETLYEIGMEYKEIFLEEGGEALDLVEAPNSDEEWVKGLGDLFRTTFI